MLIVAYFCRTLAGGFSKFQAEFPALCETNLDGSSTSSSPTAQVLGLGGLRISSDSSDIESDIDRDPCSATDSDGSPLSNPQPSFPVEILPHLYLGCAKDATNLDVLEEYGIKYILNVTPNLPNLFENAGEFKYKQIPISDHWSQNLSQFFPEAISFIGKKSAASFRNFTERQREAKPSHLFDAIRSVSSCATETRRGVPGGHLISPSGGGTCRLRPLCWRQSKNKPACSGSRAQMHCGQRMCLQWKMSWTVSSQGLCNCSRKGDVVTGEWREWTKGRAG